MKEFALLLVLSVALPWVGPAAASPRDDWSKATSAFQAALASGNDAQVAQAASKVAADNSVRAVDFLLKPLRMNPQPGIYWAVLGGLSKVTDAKAFDAIATEVLKGKIPELRRDLIMALRLAETASAVEPLTRILKEGTPELQVSAMDELVDRGVVGTVPVIIELAEKDPKEERELTRRCFKAIRALVKEDPPGGPATWKAWWEKKSGDVRPEPDAGTVRRKAGETVVESVRRSRATEVEDLKKGSKEEILVFQGANDAVEDVLFRLGVKHTICTRQQLEERLDEIALERFVAVFINCGIADLSPRGCERFRKYVEAGGYLFANDVAIQAVIKRAFPGLVDVNHGALPDLTLEIVPIKGSTGNPLLRGIDIPVMPSAGGAGDSKPGRMQWVIDAGGPAIGFDPKKACGLVEAPSLASRRKPTAVAVTFTYGADRKTADDGNGVGGVYEELGRMGGGRVLCVLSHFKKQRGEDGFTLENLLLNFLIEAKDRSLMREAKKPEKKPGKSP